MTPHFGIYRAVVTNIADPLHTRRLQVLILAVLGEQPVWAEPCVPPGSRSLPKAGSTVWVQFEAGDPARPVWVGVRP